MKVISCIFLTRLSGAGKPQVGRAVARQLGWTLVGSDVLALGH